MNNLKFRAWLKDENKMVEVKSLHLSTRRIMYGYSISNQNCGNTTKSFDDVVLMQATGLKDINGNDIYEGDLLNGDYYTKYPLICKFEDCAFRVEIKYCGDNILKQEAIDFFKLEVIGNIYENKELIEND